MFTAISVPARAVIPVSVSVDMPYSAGMHSGATNRKCDSSVFELALHQQPLSASRKKAVVVNLLALAVL